MVNKLSIDWTITIRIDQITKYEWLYRYGASIMAHYCNCKKNSWVTIVIIQRKSWKYNNCMVFIAECIHNRANIEMNTLRFRIPIYISLQHALTCMQWIDHTKIWQIRPYKELKSWLCNLRKMIYFKYIVLWILRITVLYHV